MIIEKKILKRAKERELAIKLDALALVAYLLYDRFRQSSDDEELTNALFLIETLCEDLEGEDD